MKDDRSFFYAGVEDKDLPLRTCVTKQAPFFFSFDDWSAFNLYGDNNETGSLLLSKSKIPPCDEEGFLNEPFGGQPPTVGEASTMGSSIGSEITSRAPSSFSQSLSRELAAIDDSDDIFKFGQYTLLDSRAQFLWGLIDQHVDLAVCGQSNRCGIHDALFSHTGIQDAASLGMTIGQHHSIDKAVKGKTLKIVYTIHTKGNEGSFIQYFKTDFNEGIPPGGYIWPPQPSGDPATSPWASMQIFDSYLDQKSFNDMLTRVNDTFVETVRMDLTTVANPKLHVAAGQKVDLLVLIISNDLPISAIPTGSDTAMLSGEVARSTAASEELLEIVREFAGSGKRKGSSSRKGGKKTSSSSGKSGKKSSSSGKEGKGRSSSSGKRGKRRDGSSGKRGKRGKRT